MAPQHAPAALSPLVSMLRCVECRASLEPLDRAARALRCTGCGAEYPVVDGSPRMLRGTAFPDEEELKRRTAESFAYEWEHFGSLRDEWEKNFRDYMRPHLPESFRGRLFLDVGAGSGRHSYYAHRLGARVVAADIGDAIHVARANLPPDVLTVQADAEALPFEEGSFDFVASIGVLHHLPDPERALRAIGRLVRPGGYIQVYLYWQPPVRWHRTLLRLVSTARRVTNRMPRPLLRLACYPLAAGLYAAFVLPYRATRHRPRLRRIADTLPLKTYADYPFIVCVNDQFDRFSAPLERRYTREEVESMLERAGFEAVTSFPTTAGSAAGGGAHKLSQRRVLGVSQENHQSMEGV